MADVPIRVNVSLALLTCLAIALPGARASAQSPAAEAPSFDCRSASGQVEQLVCRDAALAALDRKMAQVYAAALGRWPAGIVTTQRAYQRGWIAGRDGCSKADDVRACVAREYQTRIVQIQVTSGQLVAPETVAFTCTGGANQRFFAAFYNDTTPHAAVLTYGDDQVVAFVAPSGSGARYTAPNVEYLGTPGRGGGGLVRHEAHVPAQIHAAPVTDESMATPSCAWGSARRAPRPRR